MARKSQPVKKPTAKQTAAQKRQTQNRREIWALVCIFLAIFSIICCFNTTAFLIRPFASLIAGLFGQAGRYILPLALIATVVILFTSRGKPVRLRIVSVFTLILTVSAVYHLIQGEALVWEWKVVPALFKGGIAGTTGGLLGGLLAMLLKTGITVVEHTSAAIRKKNTGKTLATLLTISALLSKESYPILSFLVCT